MPAPEPKAGGRADGLGVVLRSALFNAYFFALTFVLCVAGVPLRWMAPAPTHALARLWARLTLAGLRAICGIRVKVLGREHLAPSGPMLIAAEHQSTFDTIIWHVLLPAPAYVVKRELMRLPLFGPLLRSGGQIELDRSAGAAALRGLLRDTDRAVAQGRAVVIFPQGTRTAPGERVPLLPGVAAQAAHTRLPVIPVATDSGRSWGRRAFRKRAGIIHVIIGQPIPPGLPRAALLARIEATWQANAARVQACA